MVFGLLSLMKNGVQPIEIKANIIKKEILRNILDNSFPPSFGYYSKRVQIYIVKVVTIL
jgi:hypothetical protein